MQEIYNQFTAHFVFIVPKTEVRWNNGAVHGRTVITFIFIDATPSASDFTQCYVFSVEWL